MLYTICQYIRFFVVLYAVVPIVSSLLDIPGMDIIDFETDNVRIALKAGDLYAMVMIRQMTRATITSRRANYHCDCKIVVSTTDEPVLS